MSAGSAATEVLAPLVAVTTLRGGPADVAGLLAITLSISLILRLPLAAWADRLRAQPRWMVLFALLSATWSLVLPAIWLGGILSMPTLFAWMAINVVILTVISVVGHGVLNRLTQPDKRVGEVGRLNAATNAGEIIGQSGAPALLAVLAAPLAMIGGAIIAIAAALSWTRISRVVVEPTSHDTSERQAGSTYKSIATHLSKNPKLWIAATASVLSSVTAPLGVYYFINVLQVDPALIGVLLAGGAVGGIVAGILLGRLYERLSAGSVVTTGLVMMAVSTALIAALPPATMATFVGIAAIEFLTAVGGTLLMATVFGEIQAYSTSDNASRYMATAGFLVEALALVGLGLGAVLAELWSPQMVYVVTGVALLILAGVYLTSRLSVKSRVVV